MTTSHEQTFDELRGTLTAYGRAVRQRWRLGFVSLAVVGAAALWCSQYVPRRYSASTLFERRDDVVLRNLVQGSSPYSFDNFRATLALDMTGSRALAEAAVATGLLPAAVVPPRGPLSQEALQALDAALLRHKLTAKVKLAHSAAGLDAIRVECEANSPEISQQFVTALRDRYIAESRRRITDVLVNTRKFFGNEIARLKQQMGETQQLLRAQFQDFPGVDPTDLRSAGALLESLRQELTRLGEHRASLEAQVAAREQFLAATLPPQDAQPQAGGATARATSGALEREALPHLARAIREVETQIADATLVKRMTAQHPTVAGLRAKLETLWGTYVALEVRRATEGSAATAAVSGPEQAHLRTERLRVQLEMDALQRQHRLADAAYRRAEERAQRFAGLFDQLVRRSDELGAVRDRLEQDAATIAAWRQHVGQLDRILSAESEQRGTQFTLLEEPKDTERAAAPRVASVFTVCTGAGLAVAALLMALAELLDRSFRSAGSVARSLGVPVLECVGVIPTPAVRRRRLLARLLWTPTLLALLGVLALAGGMAYLSLERPDLHRRAAARLDAWLPEVGGLWSGRPRAFGGPGAFAGRPAIKLVTGEPAEQVQPQWRDPPPSDRAGHAPPLSP